MESEEIEKVLELLKNGIYDSQTIATVKDVSVLLDKLDELEWKKKIELILRIKIDDIIKYINENGKQKEKIMELFKEFDFNKGVEKIIKKLNNDSDKTKILLYSNTGESEILSFVETPYYKNLMIKKKSIYYYVSEELIESVVEYEAAKKQLEELETEEEKAEFIATLEDYVMRLDFLNQIKDKENRNIIINSFQPEIDPKIKGQVNLVQKMIKEYFEDTLGDKLDQSKKERLEIVFRTADVTFGTLKSPSNGEANYLLDEIVISNKYKYNNNLVLGYIAHEYQHLLSEFNFKTTGDATPEIIEEGMADLFADLVINHYLEKHEEVKIDGRRVRIEKPYQTYSGYDFENSWSRTMLYGLRKKGKDIEALAEYVLGDKRKFVEMVYGREISNKENLGLFGLPDKDISKKELYDSPKLDFSEIDFESIYAERNFILPLYELQNRLNSKGINVDIVENIYNADCIGSLYFEYRKLYEIPREEMEEFSDLLIAQTNPIGTSNLTKYGEFYDNKIRELDDEEISKYSFEILDTTIALWKCLKNSGTNLQDVFGMAINKEIDLIQNGQPLEESVRKYIRIIPDYLKLIDPEDDIENLYIYDFICDLKFSYLEQIREGVENGRAEEVIEFLRNEENNEIYIDSDIAEIFEDYNILIKDKEELFSQQEVGKSVIKLYSVELVDEAFEKINRNRDRDRDRATALNSQKEKRALDDTDYER